MDSSEFKTERVGNVKKMKGGYYYFDPKELPFEINYTPELIKIIATASNSLGRLSEAGRKLKNPHIFINPYLKKEAVLSSKIEGTRATLSDVFINQVEEDLNNQDINEINNYIKALEFGLDKIKIGEKISVKLIKEMHHVLLQGVRGRDKDPGQFKKVFNFIGTSYDPSEAKFIPAMPEDVERLMENLINYLNDNSVENELSKIAIAHYQFETIHPFRDGNGRIGRLIIALYLCQQELISQPLFYISEFFENFENDYKDLLKRVSTDGDIERWLRYFLTGVRVQSNRALEKIEILEDLRDKYRQMIKNESKSIIIYEILDLLFENPYITIKEIQKRLTGVYNKAKYNIDILLRLGILHEYENRKRNRIYIAKEIEDILKG